MRQVEPVHINKVLSDKLSVVIRLEVSFNFWPGRCTKGCSLFCKKVNCLVPQKEELVFVAELSYDGIRPVGLDFDHTLDGVSVGHVYELPRVS